MLSFVLRGLRFPCVGDHRVCKDTARSVAETTVAGQQLVSAPALIGPEFAAASTDQRWCPDVTYIRNWTGWAYLATGIDLQSRTAVAVADHLHRPDPPGVPMDRQRRRRLVPKVPRPKAPPSALPRERKNDLPAVEAIRPPRKAPAPPCASGSGADAGGASAVPAVIGVSPEPVPASASRAVSSS